MYICICYNIKMKRMFPIHLYLVVDMFVCNFLNKSIMKKILFFLSLLLLSIISACSPYTLLNSTVYNEADFEMFKTFRIATAKEDQLPPKMSMVDYYNISNAIRYQLLARGFTEDPNSPMLVNFGITYQMSIQTEPAIPPGYWPGYWGGWGGWQSYWMYPRSMYLQNYYQNAEIITGIQKEGVLTIDIVDLQSKSYVWSASVESVLTDGNQQFREQQSIQQIVQLAFSKFPIPLPKTTGK